MRLNKYIAQAGVASRREADRLTLTGQVKINGLSMREPGYDVKPGDVIEVKGRVISNLEKKYYLMLNKPKGYVTTTNDQNQRLTVMDLVTDVAVRVFPVGRLDYNTTGLLIMTNDGDLSHKLMLPAHKVGKTYRARVAGILSKAKVSLLQRGVDIGGYVTSPAEVTVIKQTDRSAIVDITIYEGKNRQVRKMFSSVGCPVQELTRTALGDLYLARLAEGHYRKLTPHEVEYLKSL